MFLSDEQVDDLCRAIDVFTDTWGNDNLSSDEFDKLLDAFDEIVDGKISYNQFIFKTGISELKKYLLM